MALWLTVLVAAGAVLDTRKFPLRDMLQQNHRQHHPLALCLSIVDCTTILRYAGMFLTKDAPYAVLVVTPG
jgi:hypothetical protein